MMDFPWMQKKDPRKEDAQPGGEPVGGPQVEAAARQQSAMAAESPDQLGQLERMLHEAREQVARVRMGRAADDAVSEKLELVLSKLDSAVQGAAQRGAGSDTFILPLFEGLARKLDDLEKLVRQGSSSAAAPGAAGGLSAEALGELAGQIQMAFGRQDESLGNALRHIYARMEAGFGELAGHLRPAAPAPVEDAPALPAGIADWQRVILGHELADNPALSADSQRLITGVLQGQYEARALAGQLLVFQSAVTEKMPTLLKDIGEAYYRWQPKTRPGTGNFEQALVHWLQETCDSAGIPNTIEFVDPGERFDAGRHNSTGRGVEITQVLGWVVLRDNGKVYTKALVEVR